MIHLESYAGYTTVLIMPQICYTAAFWVYAGWLLWKREGVVTERSPYIAVQQVQGTAEGPQKQVFDNQRKRTYENELIPPWLLFGNISGSYQQHPCEADSCRGRAGFS